MRYKYTEEFEAFWAAFPLRVGKRDAAKAFKAAIEEVDVRELVDAAIRYAEWMKLPAQATRNFKHAQGWLNAARWEDEYPMPEDRSDGLARQREGLRLVK